MPEATTQAVSALSEALLSSSEEKVVLARTAEHIGCFLGASRCIVSLENSNASAQIKTQPPIEWAAESPDARFDASVEKLSESIRAVTRRQSHVLLLSPEELLERFPSEKNVFNALQISQIAAFSSRRHGMPQASVVVFGDEQSPEWDVSDREFLEHCGRLLAVALERCQKQSLESTREVDQASALLAASPAVNSEERYRRLVEHSDAIIFHCDPKHTITFVSRRALDFFGVAPEDFLAGTPVRWFDLAHLEDRERVKKQAVESAHTAHNFEEEFRVINHITGKERWLLAKFVPVRAANGKVLGWDGFGIDITARREAQQALNAQSKKVRALYTVSSAIRGYLDPANISTRGLAALCDATGASAGLCFLYEQQETENDLQLIAHHGFSTEFDSRVQAASSLPSLSKFVAQNGQSIVVPDIRSDPRASRFLAEDEGMRSAVLVPISVEEEILGTIGLFHTDIAKFDGGDVMLVAAAANQIGLAARQAKLFTAYKKQTKNLAALYRLSHELSGFLSLEEIFHKAFDVIKAEVGLSRIWLGLLNETNTRIIGQAAFGPGWKRRLVEINVEIEGREHPIAQVVASRSAIIIEDPEEVLSEFGVKRFFSRFSTNSVGLVPLISGGQVLGVLAFQAGAGEPKIDKSELRLLSSLASEIAAVLLSKRLEERVGASEKMRTAGLLAAGIAHNFNNLLQAILGQASLLELQGKDQPPIERAAKIINDAAIKGASLVKQLLSFANLEEPSAELADINAVIERNKESLRRQLGDEQELQFQLADSLPKTFADPEQVMRILNSLTKNATEASPAKGRIEIFSDSITVDRDSPHYEVPYGEYIRIGIRDEGEGMDPETKRRCFEPFFTTKDVDPSSGLSMSGAGLGLAAAYALARKNGGRLVVDSRKGHGSVFTLYIPISESAPAASSDEEIPVVESLSEGILRKEEEEEEQQQVQTNLRLVAPSALEIEVERIEEQQKQVRSTQAKETKSKKSAVVESEGSARGRANERGKRNDS